MSVRKRRVTCAAVCVAYSVTACVSLPPPGTALTAEQRKEAQNNCIMQYTVAGAIGGAILGQLLGRDARATALGAVAGGAVATALAWGKCLNVYSDLASFPVADAQQTAQQTGWQPSRGDEVRIQSYVVAPREVAPGSGMNMNASYYVMADGKKDIKVTETRALSYFDPAENQWKDLGSVDQSVTANAGTRRAEGRFDLPTDVPAGRYRLTLKVAALGKIDQKTEEITVRRA
jgi:hypothetical protein